MSLSYELVRTLSQTKGSKKQVKTIIDLIKDRLNRKFDIRILVAGEPGIGKSSIILSMCQQLDDDFIKRPKYAVDHKLTYSALDYLKAMKSEKDMSCLVMDESGQALHHREFMSDVNVIISKTMQGNRYRSFVQIFAIPVLEMLDKDARYLIQLYIYVNARGDAEVNRVIVPKFEGKIWYKKMRDHYYFKKPNYRLWQYYEDKKFKTQGELYDKFIDILSERDKPELTYTQLKDKVLSNPSACMKGERWNVKRMQAYLEISRDKVEVVKALIDQEDEASI